MGGAPEYRGMVAELWDLLRGDTSDWSDRPFYLEVIERSGEPALDVGCGTGRLLLDYLARGIDVEGVDNSAEMLALCRAKASALGLSPRLYEQPMERLELPHRYRTILVPSSSFQLVTDREGAREALRRFREHLVPRGTLVMPFMVYAARPGNEWRLLAERTRAVDGAVVRRWGRSRLDLDARLEHTENRYEVWRGDSLVASELHVRSPATRWYTQREAVALYEEAGFGRVTVTRGFTDEPAAPDDSLFCVLGRA